ncbi:unnamed protein product [Absidia cylindrospora]
MGPLGMKVNSKSDRYDSYVMHSGSGNSECKTMFSMDFQSNGKVNFKILDYSYKDQYLCPNASGNYVTRCSTPYDFDYLQVSSTSYGGAYKIGWNGYSLDWSNESAKGMSYCYDDGIYYLRISGTSMKDGESFHVFEDTKIKRGKVCSFDIDYNNYTPRRRVTVPRISSIGLKV